MAAIVSALRFATSGTEHVGRWAVADGISPEYRVITNAGAQFRALPVDPETCKVWEQVRARPAAKT